MQMIIMPLKNNQNLRKNLNKKKKNLRNLRSLRRKKLFSMKKIFSRLSNFLLNHQRIWKKKVYIQCRKCACRIYKLEGANLLIHLKKLTKTLSIYKRNPNHKENLKQTHRPSTDFKNQTQHKKVDTLETSKRNKTCSPRNS